MKPGERMKKLKRSRTKRRKKRCMVLVFEEDREEQRTLRQDLSMKTTSKGRVMDAVCLL